MRLRARGQDALATAGETPALRNKSIMTEAGKHSRAARVAIVGTGNVGATFAYALLLSGLAAEIVLIDANKARAEGEAMDLNHAVPFTHPTRVWAGDYADCAGAVVTVLAAGADRSRARRGSIW